MSNDVRIYGEGDFIYTFDAYQQVQLHIVYGGEIRKIIDTRAGDPAQPIERAAVPEYSEQDLT